MSRKQWITVVLRSTEEKKAQKDSEKSFAWNQQHKFIRAALGEKKTLSIHICSEKQSWKELLAGTD